MWRVTAAASMLLYKHPQFPLTHYVSSSYSVLFISLDYEVNQYFLKSIVQGGIVIGTIQTILKLRFEDKIHIIM